VQADYSIAFKSNSGVFEPKKDLITLEFTNKVAVLKYYPYDLCTSGSEIAVDRTTEIFLDDTVGTATNKGKEKIELWLKNPVRDNAAVYFPNFDAVNGEQNDVLQFCLYAATTDDELATGTEVGFAEVKVKLTYTANGIISDFDEIVKTDKNSIADANEGGANNFDEVFNGLKAFLCELDDKDELKSLSGTNKIYPGQPVGVCIGFNEPDDEPEFRMNTIKSCSYHGAAAAPQPAIADNTAAPLTTYTYKSYDDDLECKTEDTECHTLFFESNLNVDFFLGLSEAVPLNVTCIVQVVPILKGSKDPAVTRRLASELSDDEYKVELDLTIEAEEDGNNLILIIAGAVGGVCLLCLICCLVACAKRRHRRRDDEDEDNEKPATEEDDGQCTVDSAHISSDVGEAPEA